MTQTGSPPVYGRGHRALEIAGIAFLFVALGWVTFRIWSTVHGTLDLLYLSTAALGGYLISDFLSGLVHWAGDTVGDENTPLFGPNFVRPFRYHHVDPLDMTRHGFIETNGNNCIVAAPALLLVVLLMPRTTGTLFYGCVIVASTAWFVFCTNQFHKWAHAASAPRWVRALQRAGIILSPEHHAIHHAWPQNRYYCITVGWMNPVLDRIHFFRFCEVVTDWLLPGSLRPDNPTTPSV